MFTSQLRFGRPRSLRLNSALALAGAALLSIAGCPTSVNNYGFEEDFGAAEPRTSDNVQSPAPAATPVAPSAAPLAPAAGGSPAPPPAAAPASNPAPPGATPAVTPAAPAAAADAFQGLVVAPSYIALGPLLSVFVASSPAFAGWANDDLLAVDSAGQLANLTRGGSVGVSYLGDVMSVTSIAEITMDWWGLGWDVRLADGTAYTTDFTYDNWPGDQVLIVRDLQMGTGAMYMINITRNQHVFIY